MAVKVHIIETDLAGGLPRALAQHARLAQDIVSLSRRTGEQVWFHDYKTDESGGAPKIMLECSDSFLAAVRKLPDYRKDRPLAARSGIERSAALQSYFFSGGEKARAPGGIRKFKP